VACCDANEKTVRPERSRVAAKSKGTDTMFSLYILECSDKTLYIGQTDNPDERMRQHDVGTADAYTSKRRPLKLLHAEEFESRYDALTMERKLKGWSKAKKLAYIAGDWAAVRILAKGKHEHER
jgi:predicted GIY-YIG superfamily endonuclease